MTQFFIPVKEIKTEAVSTELVKDDVPFDYFKAFFDQLNAQEQHALSYRKGADTETEIPDSTPLGEVYPYITWGRLIDFVQENNLVELFSKHFTIRKVTRFVA